MIVSNGNRVTNLDKGLAREWVGVREGGLCRQINVARRKDS